VRNGDDRRCGDPRGGDPHSVGTTPPAPTGTSTTFMTHAAAHHDALTTDSLRSALWEMAKIAAPVVATMTSYTVMQFVDKLMVSRIQPPDPVYVAAQGNGALASFVPIAVVMGLLGVINTYVSQNHGAGRPERGAAYAWNGLWLALLAQLALIPYALALPSLIGRLGHSEQLQAIESRYAQILIAGAFLTMGTRGIAHFFYGLHRPMTVLVAALVGNVVNVGANYLLIYGHFGFPELRVNGAAVGTVIGTAVELAIPIAVFLSAKYNRLYGTRSAWRLSIAHIRDILRIGWPAAMMFGSEMICWGYFMVVLLGKFGEAQQMAGWIALQYMHLSFMPAVGLSIAVTAVVGKAMGARRPDLAARRAYLGMGVTMMYMGVCALVFVAMRQSMVGVFIAEGMEAAAREEILRIGARVMIVAAVFQLFDAMAITISAALRGAGDTVWPGVITMALAWTCIVGGGHAMIAWAPGLESLGPWIGSASYIVLLGLILTARFLLGRWKQIDLLGRSASAGAMTGSEAAPGDAADAAAVAGSGATTL